MIFEFPLLRRELVVEVLRTRRAIVLVVLAVGLSSALTLLAWPRGHPSAGWAQQNVFTVLLFLETQLTAAILIIPAFTAGAIAGERERGTYELLHATLLSPRAIVFAKALSSTGFVLILLAAAAPMACSLYLLGGVSFSTLLECYAVTFASVILSGWICLYASMRSERTSGAVVRGMAWVIFWNAMLYVIGTLIIALDGGRPPDWLVHLFSLSPHAAIFWSIVKPNFGAAPFLAFEPWVGSVAYSAFLSALLLALLLLRARVPDAPESAGGRAGSISGRLRRLKRRSILTGLIGLLGDEGAAPFRNPVFLKEIRSEFFGRTIYRSCVFWGTLAIFLMMVMSTGSWAGDEAVYIVFVAAIIFAALIAPATAASAFTREMEQGNFDFLRSTLLGFYPILRGKLLAALYSVSGIVFAALLSCFAALFALPGDCAHSVSVLLVTIFTAVSISLAASAVSKRTVTALVLAYGLLLLWLAVLPATLGLLRADQWVFIASGPFGALFAFEGGSPSRGARLTGLFLFYMIHLGGSLVLLLLTGAYLQVSRSRDP